MASFADGSDLLERYDARTVGDLAEDLGARVAAADIPTSANVVTALSGATGEILSSVARAARYTQADLVALTGEDLAYLKDLTCAIAFWRLWKRRPYTDDAIRKEAREEYESILKMLRSGETIFAVAEVIDAGKPQIETVTRVEAPNWQLVVDRCRGRFFPSRRTYRNR